MTATLSITLDASQMIAISGQVDQALGRISERAVTVGHSVDRTSNHLRTVAINSLQAANNMGHMLQSTRSLLSGTTNLAAGISSMGAEFGLLIGNFLHFQNAAQAAGGGLAGFFKTMMQNPLVPITAGIMLAAQAFAILGTNAKKAHEENRQFFASLSGIGEASIIGAGGAEASARAISALRQRDVDRLIANPLGEGKTASFEASQRLLFGNMSTADMAKLYQNATGLTSTQQQTTFNSLLLGPKMRGGGPTGFTGGDIEQMIAYQYARDRQGGASSAIADMERRAGLSDIDRSREDYIRRFRNQFGSESETDVSNDRLGRAFDYKTAFDRVRQEAEGLGAAMTSAINVDMWKDWESAGISTIRAVANEMLQITVARPLAAAGASFFANVFAPASSGAGSLRANGP